MENKEILGIHQLLNQFMHTHTKDKRQKKKPQTMFLNILSNGF